MRLLACLKVGSQRLQSLLDVSGLQFATSLFRFRPAAAGSWGPSRRPNPRSTQRCEVWLQQIADHPPTLPARRLFVSRSVTSAMIWRSREVRDEPGPPGLLFAAAFSIALERPHRCLQDIAVSSPNAYRSDQKSGVRFP